MSRPLSGVSGFTFQVSSCLGPGPQPETGNLKRETCNYCLLAVLVPVRHRSGGAADPEPGGNPMIGEDVMAAHSETDQLREQLLRAQRLSSVGTLASSVAHEFNNILTTIINYAKLGLRADGDEA